MFIFLILLMSSGGVFARMACPQVDASRNVYPAYAMADAIVAFEASSDPDNPVNLVLYRGAGDCSRTVIDTYPVEGSAPRIASVFPYTLKGKPSLFVIVTWKINSRGLGTYGTLYQVYAYEKDGAGGLASNRLIAATDQMTGIEGMADGESSHFGGKTAAEVKKRIDLLHFK